MVEILLEHVSCSFPKLETDLLQNLTVTLHSGSVIALVGKNGSGKTTLLKIISGIIKPDKGDIYYNKKRINGIKSTKTFVSFVPENTKLFLLGPTVLQELTRVVQSENDALMIVERFYFKDFSNRKIYELSEGQRRLLAIISALHQEKELFILDEPTIGLDKQGREILYSLFKAIKNKGGIVLIATNDYRILPHVDRIIGIDKGAIKLDNPPEFALFEMEEKIGLPPNQVSRLSSILRKDGVVIPNIITAQQMNKLLKTTIDSED